MVVFPNCKINLGLNIVRKREDGFHDLETVFYPLPVNDVLEIIAAPETLPGEDVIFSTSGLTVAGSEKDNLCLKAYRLLKADFPQLSSIQMHLHKTIPMGAGLGGGSADGARTLQLLNTKFKLGLSPEQLITYALQLGSDCPFFIINTPCFATGRGEILEPVALTLNNYYFVLVNPGIHINTGWAFSGITPGGELGDIKSIINRPVEHWKGHLINHFEAVVAEAYPAIGIIKEELYKAGAVYCSMTGSGSTVFGIFELGKTPSLRFPPGYTCLKVL